MRADADVDPRVLHAFTTLFNKIDHQIADHIETGIKRNAYLRRVTLPRLVENSGQLVAPARERFMPFSAGGPATVVELVLDRLRPTSEPSAPTRDAARSRAELHSAIVHRPEPRGGVLGL